MKQAINFTQVSIGLDSLSLMFCFCLLIFLVRRIFLKGEFRYRKKFQKRDSLNAFHDILSLIVSICIYMNCLFSQTYIVNVLNTQFVYFLLSYLQLSRCIHDSNLLLISLTTHCLKVNENVYIQKLGSLTTNVIKALYNSLIYSTSASSTM